MSEDSHQCCCRDEAFQKRFSEKIVRWESAALLLPSDKPPSELADVLRQEVSDFIVEETTDNNLPYLRRMLARRTISRKVETILVSELNGFLSV